MYKRNPQKCVVTPKNTFIKTNIVIENKTKMFKVLKAFAILEQSAEKNQLVARASNHSQ